MKFSFVNFMYFSGVISSETQIENFHTKIYQEKIIIKKFHKNFKKFHRPFMHPDQCAVPSHQSIRNVGKMRKK